MVKVLMECLLAVLTITSEMVTLFELLELDLKIVCILIGWKAIAEGLERI